MAEQKRFYWIKLKEEFFSELESIDWLISQKNGCEYVVLYLKLCLLTANKGGRLAMQIGEMIVPYDVNKIARDTKFDIDTVIVAMELFRKIGLIYEEADGVLKIPYVDEIVGSETSSAQKMRRSRARQKSLQSGSQSVSQCDHNVTQEKECRDKSSDIRFLDKEKDAEVENNGADAPDYNDPEQQLQPFRYDNVFLSDKQVESLLEIMPITVFDAYVDKVAKYPNIKNHYQTIKDWYTADMGVKK